MTKKDDFENHLKLSEPLDGPDSEVVKCDECNRPAKYLLRIGTNRDDWCYAECGQCGDTLCSQHAIPDGHGGFLCDCCAQQLALKG